MLTPHLPTPANNTAGIGGSCVLSVTANPCANLGFLLKVERTEILKWAGALRTTEIFHFHVYQLVL